MNLVGLPLRKVGVSVLAVLVAVLGCRSIQSPVTRVVPSPAVRIPLRITEGGTGHVFLRGAVNGRTGYLLLDTGNPTFLLNTHQADTASCRAVAGEWNVVQTGSAPAVRCDVTSLRWGGVTDRHVTAMGMDLERIRELLAVTFPPLDTLPLLGVVGLAQLEPYLARFDYAAQELTLIPLDGSGRPTAQVLPAPSDSTAMDVIVQPKRLRVLSTIGGRGVWWYLDTGSDVNALGSNSLEKSLVAGRHIVPHPLRGIYTVDTLVIGTLRVVSENLEPSRANWSGINLLGGPFFARQPFAINQRAGKMYFWPPSGLSRRSARAHERANP